MAYVLVSVELYPSEDERQRREQLANVLPRMGLLCHVLPSMWIIQTSITPDNVFRRLTDRAAGSDVPLSQRDRLIVAPIPTPAEGEEPWYAMNAPSAARCFNMP